MRDMYETFLRNVFLSPDCKFTYQRNADSNKYAVIVDPRYDDLMLAVIRNFMFFLNPKGWNLMIVSHPNHLERVKKDIPGAAFMGIPKNYLEDGHKPNMSIDSYNAIMMDQSFWEAMPAEHILIFQTDCIMLRPLDDAAYLGYDYAGANWYSPYDASFILGGVNGGCSLRSKQAMIDCLRYVSWDLIMHVRANIIKKNRIEGRNAKVQKLNEDVFYTAACEILHKNVLPLSERSTFAIEAEYDLNACFYHGWNKNYHNESQTHALLSSLLGFIKAAI